MGLESCEEVSWRKGALNNPKWEAVSLTGVISVREREDALRGVFSCHTDGHDLSKHHNRWLGLGWWCSKIKLWAVGILV